MGKKADRYFAVEPWRIVERGFDPAHGELSESIFSLGNEYMGLRGYFDEGYSGAGLEGSYVGGVYERRMLGRSGYKGMLPFSEMMVNTVDWVHTAIWVNGERLDLAKAPPDDFTRVLDLQTGVLTRSFVWGGVRFAFERFLSMPQPEFGGQSLKLEALAEPVHLRIEAGLDFSRIHRNTGQNHWDCSGETAVGDTCHLLGITKVTKQRLLAAARFEGLPNGVPDTRAQYAGFRYDLHLAVGESAALRRVVCLRCDEKTPDFTGADYNTLRAESAAWWVRQWAVSDIEIEGDPLNQQGIRYSVFQLHQTLHTAGRSAVIGAKGLTGEAYNGNAFWDSEVYCLPFYLLNNPGAARNILKFRYDTLPEAKQRARALDLQGAFYPIATISGHECCDLWQHANLQLQASTAVAYGLWHYLRVTDDRAFLHQCGAEMLVEICRMLDTRGAYSPTTGLYGFYCVMGPDEFQMMVHNNAYTNFMAQKTFAFALETLESMKEEAPTEYTALIEKTALSPDEPPRWREKMDKMYLPYDEERQLFEQHEGFFSLPHIDIAAIPEEEFPLYSHWAYDRIYRNDMIKQPDVLMFMLLHNTAFTREQLAASYAYYAPRCIHESSLSPSVHSILAAQLGKMQEAYALFGYATRLDLDNYNRNSQEGLHTTALAASWMNIVYGFGGLRSDGEGIRLWPCIPADWAGYSFRIQMQGALVTVSVRRDGIHLGADRDDAPELLLYGERVRPTKAGQWFALQPPMAE
ncbi:MAG: family 65 glycosyl hydrolase [Oscillospiraceae bacterium]|nr:family 65 glycosyl hydrolase [Oscillospiraceae bacterium]